MRIEATVRSGEILNYTITEVILLCNLLFSTVLKSGPIPHEHKSIHTHTHTHTHEKALLQPDNPLLTIVQLPYCFVPTKQLCFVLLLRSGPPRLIRNWTGSLTTGLLPVLFVCEFVCVCAFVCVRACVIVCGESLAVSRM